VLAREPDALKAHFGLATSQVSAHESHEMGGCQDMTPTASAAEITGAAEETDAETAGLTGASTDRPDAGQSYHKELTAKQERFAQEVASGKSLTESYRVSYNTRAADKTVNVAASKTAAKPHIRARIEAIKVENANAANNLASEADKLSP
jgi:hypothetical protein